MKSNRGFTLIEVLVSIAIFASMSVAAYQVVSQVQRSNVLSQERTQRLNELQRAMVMMVDTIVRAFMTVLTHAA